MTSSVAQFMQSVPRSSNGNTPWAEGYGRELKDIVKQYAARAPRTLQKTLGPSELGEACDRQVVMKMSALTATNHVADPWAAIMGTAGHTYLEEAFNWANQEYGLRFVTEQRVIPDPGGNSHPGTADLYDANIKGVVDWKFLGDTSRAKLIAQGPKRAYRVQLLLYRRGYLNLGLPVERIVLVAWPRTKSSLNDLYVWEHVPDDADERLVDEVLARTRIRHLLAREVIEKRLGIMDIVATPSDDSCMFCPLYRPQSAYDNSYGCAGMLLLRKTLQAVTRCARVASGSGHAQAA